MKRTSGRFESFLVANLQDRFSHNMAHFTLQFLRPLKFPWVKFVIHTISYIAFLVMIVASTVETSMTWQTRNNTISANYLTVFNKYAAIRNATDSYLYGRDIPIRESFPSTSQMLISIWVIGNSFFH